MAEVLFDRVQETTAVTGTGPVTTTGASPGFRSFASVMAVNDTTRFTIYDPVANAWEVTAGAYTAANTLSRVTTEASSNGGAKVNFVGNAGTIVFIDASSTLLGLLAPKIAPVFTGGVRINDTTQGTDALVLSAPGNAQGASFKLIGQGANPNKSIRANNGNFEVINSAYNAVLSGLDDGGNYYVLGRVSLSDTLSVSSPGFGSIKLTQGVADRTGYMAFFGSTGIRMGYIGFATANDYINFTAENGTIGWHYNGSILLDGNLSANGTGFFGGNVTINDTTTTGANLTALQITAVSNPSGANFKLTGPGATTPSKYIRAQGGAFHIINSAYSAVILGLTDSGNLTLAGTFDQLTAETNRAVAAENAKVNKNLLHNGRFSIQQRGGLTYVSSGSYPCDRWNMQFDASSTLQASRAPLSDSDRAAIGDEAAQWYINLNAGGGAAANSYVLFIQSIENIRKAAGKTITVSFWGKCTNTSTARMSCDFQMNFGTGGGASAPQDAFTATGITVTTAWQKFIVTGTVASASGKTIGTSNTDALQLYLWLSGNTGTYATRNQGMTPQTASIQITQAKVEFGNVATPMPPYDEAEDLEFCKRYLQIVSQFIISGYNGAGGATYTELTLIPAMRAAPNVGISNASYSNASAYALNGSYINHVRVQQTIAATGAGYGIADLTISAEI